MVVAEVIKMAKNQLLALTEYSTKYGVSMSTLRRRIKTDDIKYVFEDGKYYIIDQPMSTHQRIHRPSPKVSEETLVSAHVEPSFRMSSHQISSDEDGQAAFGQKSADVKADTNEREPIFSTAHRLLNELKKAYTQILQEKEDMILHLKEELTDLRTLTRVLEAENERLKSRSKPN